MKPILIDAIDALRVLVVRCENLQRHARELGSGMDDAWDTKPIEDAKAIIARWDDMSIGAYFTPAGLIEPAAVSGALLKNAADGILTNPPYESSTPEE